MTPDWKPCRPRREMESVMLVRRWLASRAAITGGLLHVAIALAILLLPVLEECIGPNCTRRPYWGMGNAAGYAFLALMVVLGIIAFATARARASERSMARLTLGVVFVTSCGLAYTAGWGFGIAFVPGTVLLLVAALLI